MKKSIFVLLFLMMSMSLMAQSNGYHLIKIKNFNKPKKVRIFEIGALGGTSWYYGDLCDHFYTFKYLKLAYGGYWRYQFNNHFAIRGFVNKGKIWGDDNYSDDLNRRIRNLRFFSDIIEVGGVMEYNFKTFRTCPYFDYTPYVFAGLAVFHFDPKSTFNGNTVRLQTLSTEGQGTAFYPDRKPYALTQISMPIGGGFKIALAHNFIIGIELGWRKTFTDYIDDVSTSYVKPSLLASTVGYQSATISDLSQNQILSNDPTFDKRGNPNAKDWYMIGGITVGYVIKSSCAPRVKIVRHRTPKRLHCPSILKF